MPRRSHTSAVAAAGGAPNAPQPAAPVVAQRLCDLLLAFPASAAGGVQWQVLARKYEERFGSRLDLAELGHTSPLAAATALLWEVLRLVDGEDTDNPVVGIEDAVALAPHPGQLGRWPSIYRALCDIVLDYGAPEGQVQTPHEGVPRSLLLSQLRPLLERHWHANFDESALGFLSEEGTFLRLKKMKHLLHAVLRWREQRQAWRRGGGRPSAVDEAVAPRLELVPSAKHNDLVLRCFPADAAEALPTAVARPRRHEAVKAVPCHASRAGPAACIERSTTAAAVVEEDVGGLRRQLELLRNENEELKLRNQLLELGDTPRCGTPELAAEPWAAPFAPLGEPATPRPPADLFDDPFEPPPEAQHRWAAWQPLCMSRKLSADLSSTADGSEFSFETSSVSSGAMTPAQAPVAPLPPAGCAMVPVWFPVMPSPAAFFDASVIPRGIVKTALEQFERLAGQ